MFKKISDTIKENKVFAGLMILTVLTCSVFFITKVSGNSMNDTYKDGDSVICIRLFSPQKGDIIVCDPNEGRRLIKRIIAVSGDIIEIKDGKTFVNGEELSESYIKEEMTYIPENSQDYPLVIPEGKIFVMGDNRNHSIDSRDTRCGLISENKIIGKVLFGI